MTRGVVERLSRVVDRRADRRGFLSRSALGATALAVAPATFAFRPVTAYAAICSCHGRDCGCHTQCCDGYTDFCCRLTGENMCPPGTIVAGWWKADGSGFCDIEGRRAPRYYLDCNLICDPGCGCGGAGVCASSCTSANCRCESCWQRAVECTRFRYGQCNQGVQCVGPIQCRVVTCVPPWEWDPSCTSAHATDNFTATHDRPCLHKGFTDVAPNAYYTGAVEWMVAEGITTGYNDDLFGPKELTRRSHMATFLWRYSGSPTGAAVEPFDDVAPNAYYTGAVEWMVAEGITTGTGTRRFSPDRYLSRAEAITFLWRLAGEPAPGSPHGFTDVPTGAYYATAVSWAAHLGITVGYPGALFRGGWWTDRAQIATMLHRYHLALGGDPA